MNELVKDWETEPGGWLISPGVPWCDKGNTIKIGDGARIDNRAKIGEGATFILNLGYADGYYKSLCERNNVAYIGAGCQWFTLKEALEHWGNHEEDRKETMCLMESAKAAARLYDLKWE